MQSPFYYEASTPDLSKASHCRVRRAPMWPFIQQLTVPRAGSEYTGRAFTESERGNSAWPPMERKSTLPAEMPPPGLDAERAVRQERRRRYERAAKARRA